MSDYSWVIDDTHRPFRLPHVGGSVSGRWVTVGLVLVLLTFGCGPDIKVWTEEYSDGSLSEEFQYYNHPDNNRRIKDGWYNSYYPNGAYREVGTYNDDQRNGEWTLFDGKGKKRKVVTYDDDQKDGEWTLFDEDGKITESGSYDDDQRDGEWTLFQGEETEIRGTYHNGRRWSGQFSISVEKDTTGGLWTLSSRSTNDEDEVFEGVFTYEDGLWNGLGILRWENGKKRGEGYFEDRGLQGWYLSYYESGGVRYEAEYVDGEAHGRELSYFESGRIKREAEYVDGKIHGRLLEFYESGRLKFESVMDRGSGTVVGHYESGEMWFEQNFLSSKNSGRWTWYLKDGTVSDEDIYLEGKCVELCEGDEN